MNENAAQMEASLIFAHDHFIYEVIFKGDITGCADHHERKYLSTDYADYDNFSNFPPLRLRDSALNYYRRS